MRASVRRRSRPACSGLFRVCLALTAGACLALVTSFALASKRRIWSFHATSIHQAGYEASYPVHRSSRHHAQADHLASLLPQSDHHTLPPKVDADWTQAPQDSNSPQPYSQTLIATDGTLTRLAIPADEEDPAEVKRAGARRSKNAHAFSLTKFPEVPLLPEGGPIDKISPPVSDELPSPGKYRVVVTADCGIYGRWQVLVHYYWYRRLKVDFPDSAMGGYTRILHCPDADDIMHLVPTIRVQQLPAGIDRGYGPMHRPWAFTQWLARMHVPEQFILMTEPDHILFSPPPLLATPTRPAAFPFVYVDCKAHKWRPHCEDVRFNPNKVPVESIYPIGNAPTMISTDMLTEMLPRWDRTVRAIHADPAADEALGWAQEMFAFTLALANAPAGPPEVLLNQFFMAQPPFDQVLRVDLCLAHKGKPCTLTDEQRFVNRTILHYTYGQDFDENGRTTYGKVGPWHWDKRDYAGSYPQLPIPPPPHGSPEAVVQLVEHISRAGMSLEYWPWWKANMATNR